mgnify:CR=1 FL=1
MHRGSVVFPHPLLPQSTMQQPFGMFPAICRSTGDFSSAYRNASSKSIIMISFLLVSLNYLFVVRNERRKNRPKLLVIYFSMLHSCRHPALKKLRIMRYCPKNFGCIFANKKTFMQTENRFRGKSEPVFLYNENPQFNWGFKKLKAMGRKK